MRRTHLITPAWLRAMSLPERLSIAADARYSADIGGGDFVLGQRLDRWRNLPPLDTESVFARYLESLGANEQQFLAVLSASEEALGNRLSDVPEWIVQLTSALANTEQPMPDALVLPATWN